MLYIRDVNFVFFQKSIIVLKKSILFRLSNLGVAISLCRSYCVTFRAPPGSSSMRDVSCYIIPPQLSSEYKPVGRAVDIATSAVDL